MHAPLTTATALDELIGGMEAYRQVRLADGVDQQFDVGLCKIDDGLRPCGAVLAAINDACAQPMALVGDRQEPRAVGPNAKPRHTAEVGMRGFQDQPTTKRQRTKARAIGLARIEGFDRLGSDCDLLNIIGRARWLRRLPSSARPQSAHRTRARPRQGQTRPRPRRQPPGQNVERCPLGPRLVAC